ncbi:hypothetical protein [Natronomonas marina]|uniref:hypothetical protein n=1 Tax=Natronomonas marina TaxID=2961939 RepID=UPI0020C9F5B1|nr:hypothetical protein [Natronomonas marina]
MTRDNGFSRRNVLRSAAALAGVGGLGGVATASDGESLRQIGPADLSDVPTDLEAVPAAAVPETSSGIGPGSMLFITPPGGGEAACTANFVWTDDSGTTYLGAAGHCFLGSSAAGGTELDEGPDLADVEVRVCVDCQFGGLSALVGGLRGEVVELGDVVYARQRTDDGTEVGFDFGLVEVPSSAEGLIDPSMPTWDGPSETGEINAGDTVVQYGNGVVTGETVLTKSRAGSGTGNDDASGSWTAALLAAPGDSGSAVQVGELGAGGLTGVEAAGILTHVGTSGTAGTNLQKAKEMATEAGLSIEVVLAG